MRSDEALMSAYVRGDQAAFRELFARYAPVLVRFLQARVGNAADAQELAQQTFLQVHRARAEFHPGGTLRPWIVTIAANLARDHLRRRSRRPETDLDDETLAAAAPTEEPAAAALRAAVSALPAALRAPVELHWFDGLPFAAVAARLGASAGAVRVRAHRGYAELRRTLAAAA
jgi:RNA polymerase sigma-70 factor (ECF subfamily)